ncbi:MAG TPA: hypothetical protein VGD58_16850 [Herpetosiphonaceae bacterium]
MEPDLFRPGAGATSFQQPEPALMAIRVLIGPGGALLLLAAIIVVWRYPLTRDRHARLVSLLERRRQRRAAGRSLREDQR